MRPDVVQPLRPEGDGYGSDVRGHKLLAYTQSPFERTIFLDGDTFVRTARVEMLFDALEVGVGVRIRVRLRVKVRVGNPNLNPKPNPNPNPNPYPNQHFELAAAFECCRVDWASTNPNLN